MTTAAIDDPAPGLRRWLIVGSTMVGSSIYLFSVTTLAVALPHMQGAFSAAPDQIAWLGTSFIIGTTVVTACSGWISTRFGRKRLFLVSIAGFTVFSILGGLASSLEEMVVYRTIQGMFGAPMFPLGQAITIDAFPRRRLGMANAIYTSGAVLGVLVGPLLGGIMVEQYDWTWAFFLNVPIGVVAFIGVLAFVPEIPHDRERRLDWFGFAALIIAITATQLALNRGQRLDWFSSTEIVLESAVAILAIYVFIVHSFTTRRPFLEPRLFRDRNFVVGLLVISAWGAQIYVPTFLVPLQLQDLGGFPTTMIGLLLTPRGAGMILGGLAIAALTDRLNPTLVFVVGVGSMVVAAWGMSLWDLNFSVWEVTWAFFLQGVGVSVSYVPVSMMAMSTLDHRLRTEGFAVYHTVLNMGSAVGLAGIFFIWARSVQTSHALLTGQVTQYNELFRYGFVPQLWDLTDRGGLMALDAEIWRQAAMISYNNSFYLTAIVTAVMVPLFLLMRKPSGEIEG